MSDRPTYIDVAEVPAATTTPPPLATMEGDTPGATPLSTVTGTASAKIPDVDLLPQQAKRLAAPVIADKHRDLIARVDDRIRKRASDILACAYMADRTDEPEVWAKMTPRQRKVAVDANKNNREAPVYLAMAAKTLDSYKRAESNRPPVSPELHADIKVYVRQELTVNYRTMDLEDRDE